MNRDKYDYLFLKRLAELNKELSDRNRNCSAVLESMLAKNTAAFPDYTDHTILHSMNVLDFSDRFVRDHIDILNAEEIYCFVMAVATHDIGMSVNRKDLDEFSKITGIGKFMEDNPNYPEKQAVRRFHNDLSYCMVMKYWDLFDIPDETYAKAIALIGQGHRKMDLMDENIYPMNYTLSNGTEVRLPLLAALVRVADEVDMAADRNSAILYSDYFDEDKGETNFLHMKKHESIKSITLTDERITIKAVDDYPQVKQFIVECVEDLFEKLEYAVKVMAKYDTFLMDQKEILFDYAGEKTLYTVQ